MLKKKKKMTLIHAFSLDEKRLNSKKGKTQYSLNGFIASL